MQHDTLELVEQFWRHSIPSSPPAFRDRSGRYDRSISLPSGRSSSNFVFTVVIPNSGRGRSGRPLGCPRCYSRHINCLLHRLSRLWDRGSTSTRCRRTTAVRGRVVTDAPHAPRGLVTNTATDRLQFDHERVKRHGVPRARNYGWKARTNESR